MNEKLGVLLSGPRSSFRSFRCPACGSGTDALFAPRGSEPPAHSLVLVIVWELAVAIAIGVTTAVLILTIK
jgi:uncharacterized membrane protein YphA (DoxX/SURF4 family)